MRQGPKCSTYGRGRDAARARGFTLLELMAVVTIIGIFMVLAAPGISRTFDDRRAAGLADDVAGLFRIARTRAAATGAAHVIRVTAVGSVARFELMAGMVATTGAPVASCFAPSWIAGRPDVRMLQVLDPAAEVTLSSKHIEVVATPTNVGMYCFTPGGSSWWSGAGGGTWTRPVAAANLFFEVNRKDTSGNVLGFRRYVRVGATGMPRVDVE